MNLIIKKFFKPLFLLTVTLVIVFPRFYQLDSTPPGLHIDEVSFAADAKSLAESLRDTHGVFLPRVFEAFGEYKAPGLTYSMAFLSYIFDRMDNGIARMPSAIAGIFSILMLVFTLRTIYPGISVYVLALSALILAYSPWHFDMSRIFYEAFSAMAWMSISIYLATRQILIPNKVKSWEWWATLATASIAGYYYASLRYVIICYVLIISYLTSTGSKNLLKRTAVSLLVVFLVGIFWVGDLFSGIGLKRLYHYQEKANYGQSLEIDEKRQFCYLVFDRDANKSKACYLIWNKPISKITGGLRTIATYLGSNFLFINGEPEHGFDSQYGMYLLPLLPIYIIGLWIILSHFVSFINYTLKRKSATNESKLYFLYISTALLSLVPAGLALNINVRMGMIMLYLLAIVICVGLVEFLMWLQKNITFSWLRYFIHLSLLGVLVFYVIQSTAHYYLVFTKSNDLQWTSDAGAIFNYVKSISNNYDRIVDTELHGPLAPYFYGDITTEEVHQGEYSEPDDLGFFYLIKAGKYELRHINIFDLACEVFSNGDSRKTLLITKPYSELISSRKFASYSWNKTHLMHEVHDLADVISYLKRTDPNFINRCGPKK
ncbi:MAG: hypothetical protein Fur0011_5980 [Candidatus Microgenomates bacterium]